MTPASTNTYYVTGAITSEGLGVRVDGSTEPLMFSDLVKAVGFVLHLAAEAVEEKLEEPGCVVYTYQRILKNLKAAGFESEEYKMWPVPSSDLDLLSGLPDGKTKFDTLPDPQHLAKRMDNEVGPFLVGLFHHISTLEDQETRDKYLKVILSPPSTSEGDDEGFVGVYQSLLSLYICWWLSENAFSLPNDDRLRCYDQLLTHLGQLFPPEDEPKTERSGDGDAAETKPEHSMAQMFLRRKIEEIQATIKVARLPVDITTLVAWLWETEHKHRTKRERRSPSYMMTHLQGGWLLAVVFMFLNQENLLKYRDARAHLRVLDGNNRIEDFDQYFELCIDREIKDHVENVKWTRTDEYGGNHWSLESEYRDRLVSRILDAVRSVSSHRDAEEAAERKAEEKKKKAEEAAAAAEAEAADKTAEEATSTEPPNPGAPAEDSDEDSDGAGDSGDDSDRDSE